MTPSHTSTVANSTDDQNHSPTASSQVTTSPQDQLQAATQPAELALRSIIERVAALQCRVLLNEMEKCLVSRAQAFDLLVSSFLFFACVERLEWVFRWHQVNTPAEEVRAPFITLASTPDLPSPQPHTPSAYHIHLPPTNLQCSQRMLMPRRSGSSPLPPQATPKKRETSPPSCRASCARGTSSSRWPLTPGRGFCFLLRLLLTLPPPQPLALSISLPPLPPPRPPLPRNLPPRTPRMKT